MKDDVKQLIDAGDDYSKSNLYKLAIQKYQKAIRLLKTTNPSDKDGLLKLYRILALEYFYDNNFSKAETVYNCACKIAQEKGIKKDEIATTFRIVGDFYLHLDKYKEAEKFLTKAISNNNTDHVAYLKLGDAQSFLNKEDDAFSNYILFAYYHNKDNTKIKTQTTLKEIIEGKNDVYKYFPSFFIDFIEQTCNILDKDTIRRFLGALYAFWHLTSPQASARLQDNRPVYYYTSIDVLGKMYENQHFRLNAVDCTNDPKEGKAFFEQLETYIEINKNNKDGREKEDKIKFFYDFIQKIMDKSKELVSPYICCFTENNNQVMMWNSEYGQNGHGLAIEISENKILHSQIRKTGVHINHTDKAELYKVIYIANEAKPSKKAAELNESWRNNEKLLYHVACYTKPIINAYGKMNCTNKDIIASAMAELFGQIAHLVKYNDYEHEHEHRLVYFMKRTGNLSLLYNDQFKAGTYLETDRILFTDDKVPDKIILGPVCDDIEYNKIRHLFGSKKSYDGKVEIEKSKVPYRTSKK
jgi:tetratricopeptide (TPR) repeat protein